MNKKVKWLAVLFVILAIVCNAEDCASLVGLDKLLSPEVSGPRSEERRVGKECRL